MSILRSLRPQKSTMNASGDFALQRLDEAAKRLQKEGKFLEALECAERALLMRKDMYGFSSEEVAASCKQVADMCNSLGMAYLQRENYSMALELLKKAEILAERHDAVRAVTYNNLACYYRRQGKLRTSLQYLQKALKCEGRALSNSADTHLNLCAILSQLGKHSAALEHAQAALILLQEELFSQQSNTAQQQGKTEVKSTYMDRLAVLAIAYHNMGVEQEFLKRYDLCLESYRKAVEMAEKHLGRKSDITITLANSYNQAKGQVAEVAMKARKKGGVVGAPGGMGSGMNAGLGGSYMNQSGGRGGPGFNNLSVKVPGSGPSTEGTGSSQNSVYFDIISPRGANGGDDGMAGMNHLSNFSSMDQ